MSYKEIILDFANASVDNCTSLKKIQRLKEWIEHNKFDANEYKKFIFDLDLSPADFRPYYRFSTDSYTRNRIEKSDSYELVLICWEVGQLSPVHNHGFSQCFVHCLEGSVFENNYIYKNNEMIFEATKTLVAKSSTYINNHDVYHEFGNASNTTRAVSLHLYTPGITAYNLFDKATQLVNRGDF